MRAHTIRRAAWMLATASAAIGGVLWFLPPSDAAPVPGAMPIGTLALPVIASNPEVAEDIVVANVFAASRTAPSTRYSPGEDPAESNGTMALVDEPTAGVDAMAVGPRLLGTVVSPDGPRALLQLNPALSTSRLYAVGDEDAGFRIVSITPRVVVLRSAGGRVTLRLDPEEDRP
jgi:hypothetical protein